MELSRSPEYGVPRGRVDAIEGRPARRVRDQVGAAFAGNSSWTEYRSLYYMTNPEALRGPGVARDPEQVSYAFSGCEPGTVERTLKPLPLVGTEDPVEAWWDPSPRHQGAGWIQALEVSGVDPPLYLRYPDPHYWFEYLEDAGVLYFQYNRAHEMVGDCVAELGERLLAELEARDVDAFLLDLRFKMGGSVGLAQDLMVELQERTQGMSR